MIVQSATPRDEAAKNEPANREPDRRLRVTRTEIGVVAAYIHQLADHSHRRRVRA
jgi:hypothetical protein